MLSLMVIALPASAGDRTLSINSGSGNIPYYISGETTLVMNGFDLNSFGVALPAVIDKVSISVANAVPNTPIEVVVYQDGNGGSPSDAQLVGRTQVTINEPGIFTVTFPTPLTINQPAVWVGFYLPIDFEFYSDTTGPSVLTYWGWTPNSTFNLNSLSSAQVLGPGDGSAPVNINMRGRARITLELTQNPNATPAPTSTNTTGATTPSGDTVNLSVLAQFPNCTDAMYDSADEFISLGDSINLHCTQVPSWQSPATPAGYERGGALYDIVIFRENGNPVISRLNVAVTVCIRPAVEDLETAVIGHGLGAPRQWRLMPTQRFNDLVCAEIRYGGNISYFNPIS